MDLSKQLEYVWNVRGPLLEGLAISVSIAFFALVIGFIIGVILAMIKIMPQKSMIAKILNKFADVYIAVIRGTPLLVQLLIMYNVVLVSFKYTGFTLPVPIIAFGINSGAYMAEIIRSGINSIDKGQLEAGRALGLGYTTSMIKIVVPQAVKNILPTLGNEFISLIKETSVLSFIAVYDLYKALVEVGMVNYDSMVPYIMMGLIYIVLVLIISLGIKLLERRFAKSDRN